MDSILTALNKRFDIVLQESTDKEFYLSLYHYFDYIETTQELKSIFDQSERDYYTKECGEDKSSLVTPRRVELRLPA